MTRTPPPTGGFDVDAVVAGARAHDPSIDRAVGQELAAAAATRLAAGAHDPAEVARLLIAEHPDVDVSWANHIARAAVEHVAEGVDGAGSA